MRSSGKAIVWEFARRHRWGFLAVALYLVALAVTRLLILDLTQSIRLDSAESFALVVMVPMSASFTYFLAVFSFGLEGDLGRRESIFPARMFTLPVTTTALAGWPMLIGVVAVVLLWVATRFLALWPPGMYMPLIWPAALAGAFLAWMQFFMWMPYGLPGLRVVIAVVWLTMIDVVVILAIAFNISETMMVAGLVPLIPLGFVAARAAVGRARAGDVPDWRPTLARLQQVRAGRYYRGKKFRSPAGAQLWFEWQRSGWSLPVAVALLLPFEIAVLFAADDAPMLVFLILIIVLLTPRFMASFTAASVRKSNPYASDSHVLTPFLATQPITSAALIGAKLKAMLLSTLAAWVLVALAVLIGLVWSDTWPIVSQRIRGVGAMIGVSRTTVILVLMLALLIGSTWKQLVQNLYIGLTGRDWVVKASVFLTLAIIVFLGPVVQWIVDNKEVQAELWDALPLILAILAGLKMAAAVVIVVRLVHSRLVSDRVLVVGAACWLVVVLALYGLFVWIDFRLLFPRYVLALIAILSLPLARLSASPLALAWNRHR